MRDKITVYGMILSSMPVGEYDRRLVILTKEKGKISAFAKGARKPNSQFLVGSPFAFGKFVLYEGRSSYNICSMEIENHFEGILSDLEATCYGSYFMEFADYYGREGTEETAMIRLLYASLLALERNIVPRPLIQSVFELRAMAINGEYSEAPFCPVGEGATYAWEYVLTSSMESLYRFTLKQEAFREFRYAVDGLKDHYLDRKMKSQKIIDELKDFLPLANPVP